MYVAENGEPFVLVQGNPGTGKTTVLQQVHDECSRFGHSVSRISAAALDAFSFLWNLAGSLTISLHDDVRMNQLMSSIRDELAGRALCHHRTIVLIDDIDRAIEDLSGAIDFLIAINQQTDGFVSVVASGDLSAPNNLTRRSVLKVDLPELDVDAAKVVALKRLKSLYVARTAFTDCAIDFLVQTADGNMSRIERLCEVISVAHQAEPQALIDSLTLDSLMSETLLPQGLRL